MNMREIRELAKILRDNGLQSLEVCQGDTTIRLENNHVTAPVVPVIEPMPATFLPPSNLPAAAPTPTIVDNLHKITSPMVGVFYAAPAPEAPPFVKVGQQVKRGDVLCIIEAMKLMNEITAEQDGEIAEICVANGHVVEYGQTLFKYR